MKLRDVSVVGIGSTPFGRIPDVTVEQLAFRAASDALADSGLDRTEIGALYLGNFVSGLLSGQEVLAGLLADNLVLGPIPCTKVEGACASGGIAFRHGYLAVATGMCDAVLVVGAEKMTHHRSSTITEALMCAMDQASDGRSGLTFPGLYGMAWQAYAHRYGVTREEVSEIILKNKRNGQLNPLAQMKHDLTAEDIFASPLICDPLRLYDCCPASDGAAALVLMATDRMAGRAKADIRVAASAQTRGAARLAGHDDLCSFGATVEASRQAYAQAGVGPSDIDLVELHDCFSIAEALDSEDLGLVERGKGARFAADGHSSTQGRLPINPSGGLLAKGHPVGATGVGQLFEAVTQLRGQHSNQVRGAEIALTHNLGGAGVACTVNILRRYA